MIDKKEGRLPSKQDKVGSGMSHGNTSSCMNKADHVHAAPSEVDAGRFRQLYLEHDVEEGKMSSGRRFVHMQEQ